MAFKFHFFDSAGGRVAAFKDYLELQYTLIENNVSVMELDLDPATDIKMFEVTRAMNIVRSVGAFSYIEGEKNWYLQNWGYLENKRGEEVMRLEFSCGMSRLDQAIIAYAAGTSYASKTDPADDMAKAIVRENLGALVVDADRDFSTYIEVEADASLAPSITKAFSRRGVLETLKSIAQESNTAGTYLAFDMVYVSPGVDRFQTFIGQRGVDHGIGSGDTRIFSNTRGNLAEPKLFYSYEDSKNYIYAGGQGQGVDRIIRTASDDDAINKGVVNRRELFVDARNATTPVAIEGEADTELSRRRARVSLSGKVAQTESSRYGIDYRYGDLVIAQHRGVSVDAHLDKISVNVKKKGKENIKIPLQGDAVL